MLKVIELFRVDGVSMGYVLEDDGRFLRCPWSGDGTNSCRDGCVFFRKVANKIIISCGHRDVTLKVCKGGK